METPEQQRRPTIGQSAQKLSQLGLDFDAVDLADMFWLAQFIERDRSTRPKEEPQSAQRVKADRLGNANRPGNVVDVTDSSSDEPTVKLYISDRPDITSSEPSDLPEGSETSETSDLPEASEPDDAVHEQVSTDEPEPEPPKGVPFPVPAAPALRTRLDLARSLRPLMRKVPSQIRNELDEDATVTRIAETQMMIPVARSQPERWLDLDLVVEDSKTTVIWERTITEVQNVMEYQGAFRTVRTWRLAALDPRIAQPEDIKLFPRWQSFSEKDDGQRPRSPRELLDPGHRRLILFVTDCTSVLWQRGIVHEILWKWAEAQLTSIVQLFPERLWPRTALSNGYVVRLGARSPGLPTARLEVTGLPNLEVWDEFDGLDEETSQKEEQMVDPRSLILPIVTLDPKAMQRWAKVISGSGDTQTPGRFFELKHLRQMAIDFATSSNAHAVDARTARQRVALFKATASEPAKALAKCMAATPVSLPVIDLLRDEFVPDAQQEHVAEVLLSGLLQRIDQTEENKQCQYEFFGDRANPETTERVRDLLLDDVPTAQTVNVLNHLSQLIRDRAGNTLKSFEAFLAAFEASGEALGEGALPLATIGLGVLHRLGGSHAALAKRYERVIQPQPKIDDFPLEDLEYEVAKLIDFPPLQSCEYESATITAILDRFEFETAKVILGAEQSIKAGDALQWLIRRERSSTWGYTEILKTATGEEIGLDMIAIPGGSFTMGAPTSEPESRNNERPQHEVTLQPFYLGRFPITQAQWRVVAGYDRIARNLNPKPSRFRGNNRPVEQVSWEDAQEFCQRLSAKTGKIYRLPSEAEWEYACRAGTITLFHFGETITPELANYYENDKKFRWQTTDVESCPANNWGLHDMHGNIWEWCEDIYHGNYIGAPSDGRAWVEPSIKASPGQNRTGIRKLLRGGSRNYYLGDCRSAYRTFLSCVNRSHYVGFRVCCVPPFA